MASLWVVGDVLAMDRSGRPRIFVRLSVAVVRPLSRRRSPSAPSFLYGCPETELFHQTLAVFQRHPVGRDADLLGDVERQLDWPLPFDQRLVLGVDDKRFGGPGVEIGISRGVCIDLENPRPVRRDGACGIGNRALWPYLGLLEG